MATEGAEDQEGEEMKLPPLTTAEALLRARHIIANPHQMVNEGAARRVIAGLLAALDSGGVDGAFRQILNGEKT